MRQRILAVIILVITGVGLDSCASHGGDHERGDADRASQPQTPTSRETRTSGPTSHGTSGSTAGAASGSLDTHERGSGSTGSADRNGSTATRPGKDSAPNVDPSKSRQ